MNILKNRDHIIRNRTPYIRGYKNPFKFPVNIQGVYILMLGEEITYVGMSKDVKARVQYHKMFSYCSAQFDSVYVVPTNFEDRQDLWELEKQYIDYLKPSFNTIIGTCSDSYQVA